MLAYIFSFFQNWYIHTELPPEIPPEWGQPTTAGANSTPELLPAPIPHAEHVPEWDEPISIARDGDGDGDSVDADYTGMRLEPFRPTYLFDSSVARTANTRPATPSPTPTLTPATPATAPTTPATAPTTPATAPTDPQNVSPARTPSTALQTTRSPTSAAPSNCTKNNGN